MPSRLRAPMLASQETELGLVAAAGKKPHAAARRWTWKEEEEAEDQKKKRRVRQVVQRKQPHAEVGVAEAESVLDLNLQLRRSMSSSAQGCFQRRLKQGQESWWVP